MFKIKLGEWFHFELQDVFWLGCTIVVFALFIILAVCGTVNHMW